MKLSLLVGGAVGYVLGAKAGRERYETIVRVGRRFTGSQTVQSAAGVFQAQVDDLTSRMRGIVAHKISGGTAQPVHAANGTRH